MYERMEVIKHGDRHFICMEDVIKDVQTLREMKRSPTAEESFCMDRVENWMKSLIRHHDRTGVTQ